MLSEQMIPDMDGSAAVLGCTGRSDRIIPVGKVYSWGGKQWYIPAVSVCDDGLAVDVCVRVDPEAIRTFLAKWMPVLEENPRPDEVLLRQMDTENPMKMDVRPEAVVNGTVLRDYSSSSNLWISAARAVDSFYPSRVRRGAYADSGGCRSAGSGIVE